MNLKHLPGILLAVFLSATSSTYASVIAGWTFETSQPGVVDLPATPGAGVWITNIAAEIGSGTASSLHAGNATYSSPAGNGSSHSFSANTWAVGDVLQFSLSTINAQNITVSFDQVASSTGPRDFYLAYSTDGTTFTQFGAAWTNGNSPAWSATSSNATYTHFFDLSSVSAITNQSVVYFRLVDNSTTSSGGGTVGTAGTCRCDNFTVSGATATPPVISGVSPSSITTNAGNNVTFTASVSAGSQPLFYYWYKGSVSPANLITGQTNATLTLNNVLATAAGSYFVVVSNAFPPVATAGPVTLTVIDPAINTQPGNVLGLLGGTASFSVSAAGSSLTYQWYYSDVNGVLGNKVTDGTPSYSSSVISGSSTATLTISDLTLTDPTNFVVVVSNSVGNSVSSSVGSLLSVSSTAPLAFWNFNGNSFSNHLASPPPYYGSGVASAVNVVPISGVADPNDGAGLPGFGLGGPPYFSWGTQTYAAQSTSNKQDGVQFLVSTAGARNITVSYDARGTGTASAYERLQFTTNGTDWLDYPSSTTFGTPTNIPSFSATNLFGVSGYAVSTYASFSGYDLSGFPGVDNNPNFGIRIVTEWQSTATYGASPNTNYYGIANTYGTGGTLTYDLVTISGSTITNHSAPPTIGSISNTNMYDFQQVTLNVTVGDTANPPDSVVLSAASGSPNILSPNFTFGGSGANRTMTVMPFVDQDGTAPIIVTATDQISGQSAKTWFYLTVISLHSAPTNSLAGFPGTNTLVNVPLSLPFKAGADTNANGFLTYDGSSANNSVIPSGNITFNTNTPGSPIAIITPGAYELGVAQVSVTVHDNDPTEPRSTTAKFNVEVLPNTNTVLIDYFNYDQSGSISAISSGLWGHLSGNAGQMQVGGAAPGYVKIDTLNNTENLQAKLIGAPYLTNSSAVLYASFIVNLLDPGNLPINNGTYFAVFNDGSGVTGNYACRVMAATNGAAPGFYRLGINNQGADATTGNMFPMDLTPGSNYVVVTKLVVSNGFSTVWVNPSSPSSTSVTDTTPVDTHYNISDFELRESGAAGGAVYMTKLKVGTTFDSVLPSLQVRVTGGNAIVTSSDPTLGIQSSTNVSGPYIDVSPNTPYTNAVSPTGSAFFRFGQ